METRTRPHVPTPGRAPTLRPRPHYSILLITALTIIIILAITFGGAAIALGGRSQALNVISVPHDFPTIQTAIDAASPGDVIQVQAGTYNENITLDKAVSLTAVSFDQLNPVNNTVIIDGGTGAATIHIPAGLTQMPTIRGFVIQNGTEGILASSEYVAEYNYFTSSSVLADYQSGAGGSNSNNVYFSSTGDAIRVDDLNRPLLIENNRIMYAGGNAIAIGLQNTNVPPAAVELDVWNNMLIGSGQDGIRFSDFAGNPVDTNRHTFITGNLFANNKRAGIGLMPDATTSENYSGADIAEAVRVYNNTFYGNDYGISGGDNLVAFNNIIANSTGRGVWKVQGTQGANSVVAYTLFFHNALDTDQSTLGAGDISGADPLFVAAPNPGADGAWQTVDDDFSGLLLQAGSPAIDRGVTQYTAANGELVPPNPITGFVGAAPDLGWREFGTPIFPTATATLTPSPTSVFTETPVTSTVTNTPAAATSTNTPVAPTNTNTPGPSPTNPPATPTSGSPTSGATATTQANINVQGIAPGSANAGANVSATINGSGFQNGATVSFEGGSGTAPQATSVQVLNSTTIKVTINATNSTSSDQTWNVRVSNPDGSSFVLSGGFTVMS